MKQRDSGKVDNDDTEARPKEEVNIAAAEQPVTYETACGRDRNSLAGKPKAVPSIEQIKREFIDPRTISKELDADGRTRTARAILDTRTNLRVIRERIAELEQKYQEIEKRISALHQLEHQKEKS